MNGKVGIFKFKIFSLCLLAKFLSPVYDILLAVDLVSGQTILPYKQQLIRSAIIS